MAYQNGFIRKSISDLTQSSSDGDKVQISPKKTLFEQVKQKKFDATLPIQFQDYIFDFIGADEKTYKISPVGGLVVISGKSKSRKSTALGAMIASCIDSQRHLGFKINLKGKDIAWFDTEMMTADFQYAQHLILRTANKNGVNPPNFESYQLVDFNPSQRIDAIDAIIENNKNIGCIVVDGIVDCMTNFNSLEESNAVVSRVQYWQRNGILVLPVIHLNMSNGQLKMRGHIGSLLENKANCVLEISNNIEAGCGEIACKISRKIPFPSFKFFQEEDGIVYSEMEIQERENEKRIFEDAQSQIPTLPPQNFIPMSSLTNEDCPF